MKTWVRLILLAVFLLGVFAIGKMTGFTDELTVDGIRESMREAGVGGFFVFIATFCVGQLLYIPGFVFVMVSGLAYGPLWGSVASVVAATVSVAVSSRSFASASSSSTGPGHDPVSPADRSGPPSPRCRTGSAPSGRRRA